MTLQRYVGFMLRTADGILTGCQAYTPRYPINLVKTDLP